MKGSRIFVVIGLLMVALFFGGAILGSLIPDSVTYLIIAAVAVAAALLIVFGYTGHKKEKAKKFGANNEASQES